MHAADSGYSSQGYAKDGFAATFEGAERPSIKMLTMERAIYDFLASLVFDDLFSRFPNLRIASVENGSEFLPDLLKKLDSVHRRIPGLLPRGPASRSSGATCGSTRSGKTTSTRSSSTWATTG